MIKVFILDVYALLDLGASLSFVTLYVANKFKILLEKLCEPLYVSTPIGESIIVKESIVIFLFLSITRAPWLT